MEFNSNSNSTHHFFSKLSSHPLFSTIVTLYTLILIYAPSFLFTIVLSPVLNSTGIILLFLLKLGANNEIIILEKDSNCLEPRVLDLQLTSLEQRFLDLVDRNRIHKESNQMHDLDPESDSKDGFNKRELVERMEMESKQVDTSTPIRFLKWNMKAPLEIIYEAYEGEEEDDDDDEDDDGNNMVSRDYHGSGIEKYPSLSMYYPESETDSSSDDDFPMNRNWETRDNIFFKWEMEGDDREELIEISVDRYDKRSIEFRVEEDNLIEINIFPTSN